MLRIVKETLKAAKRAGLCGGRVEKVPLCLRTAKQARPSPLL